MATGDAPPVLTTVTATWAGGHRFGIRASGGGAITIDADKQAGTGPVDTLLGALASCVSVDVVDILAKSRTPAERLKVEVHAERQGTPPRRVLKARLEFTIDGPALDIPRTERAIALAIEKYCSVASSLASDVALSSVLIINGARQSEQRREVAR